MDALGETITADLNKMRTARGKVAAADSSIREALIKARTQFSDDGSFWKWFAAQRFGLTRDKADRLMRFRGIPY